MAVKFVIIQAWELEFFTNSRVGMTKFPLGAYSMAYVKFDELNIQNSLQSRTSSCAGVRFSCCVSRP